MNIGLIGRARSGKDTAASYLEQQLNMASYAFADPLKECVNALFGWDERHSDGLLKEEPVVCTTLDFDAFHGALERHRLPEKIGNGWLFDEFIRRLLVAHERQGIEQANLFSPRISYQVFGTDTCRALICDNVWVNLMPSNCIVRDVRYPNEAAAIKDKGGILIHLSRENAPSVASHSSEQHISAMDADAYINNDGSIEELHTKLDAAMALLLN